MKRCWFGLALFTVFPALTAVENLARAQDAQALADLIIHHAKILTVDDKFDIVEAIAVKGERILALGHDQEILKLKGPKTKVIDAHNRNVLPGLYDSHTHPVGAASSEIV